MEIRSFLVALLLPWLIAAAAHGPEGHPGEDDEPAAAAGGPAPPAAAPPAAAPVGAVPGATPVGTVPGAVPGGAVPGPAAPAPGAGTGGGTGGGTGARTGTGTGTVPGATVPKVQGAPVPQPLPAPGAQPGANAVPQSVYRPYKYRPFKGIQNHMLFSYAHGIMMSMSFGILFPLGATWLRLVKYQHIAWLHGAWQTISLCLALSGVGLGIRIGRPSVWKAKNGHGIIGIIAVSIFVLQPLSGILHHRMYKLRQAPTPLGTYHRWIGRCALIMGIVNGGLGLQLAHELEKYWIAYTVVVVITGMMWFGAVLVGNARSKKQAAEAARRSAIQKTPIGAPIGGPVGGMMEAGGGLTNSGFRGSPHAA